MVTGGTGFIGRALCHSLVARGDEVVVLTRGPARRVPHACGDCGTGGTVELVTWTPDAAGPWMNVIDGADAVVHLAGANVAEARWTTRRKALLRSSRIASTRLLAEAVAAAAAKPSVFVSASAVGYYGTETGDRVVTEADPPGDDFLATLTADWEASAEPARAAGVRVCHPRLGLVLGHGGGLYARLAPLFRAYVGGPIGDGAQFVPWVHVRDVVRALTAMILRQDLEGAYNVVAPEPVTMNELARSFGEALGRPSAMRVPALAVKAAMGAEGARSILTGQRAIPKRLVDAGFELVFPDVRSALADLATRPGQVSGA